MKIGSLCTGYGGLDMAAEAYFNAETVWVSEIDKYASQVIKQRFGVVNHGDLKTINWAEVEPIDILTAGYPCQPFSHAGGRKGLQDARHIWPYIKEAISYLRPRIIVLENVRGHLSLGFDTVLKDLAEIGYDAKWQIVRAADVGAPHQRARLFIFAYPNSQSGGISLPDEAIADTNDNRCNNIIQSGYETTQSTSAVIVSNTNNQYQPYNGQVSQLGSRFTARCEMHLQAVPNVMDQNGRLNAAFVEYMMGLPVGWVTDTGLSRAQQLKMLGNGVVPQQAYYALELLATRR